MSSATEQEFYNTRPAVKPAPAKQPVTDQDKKNTLFWQQYLQFDKVFKNVGMPAALIPLLFSQVMHETGGLTSALTKDRNYSGIKYVKQKGAAPGRPAPKNEGGGFYAKYATNEDWARDFKRIISLNRAGAGRPIDAKMWHDYIKRLKANGYFGVPLATYQNAVYNWANKLKQVETWYKNYHKEKGMPEYQSAGDWNAADDVAAERQRELAGRADREEDTFQGNIKKHWKLWLGGTLGAIIVIRALK